MLDGFMFAWQAFKFGIGFLLFMMAVAGIICIILGTYKTFKDRKMVSLKEKGSVAPAGKDRWN